MITITETNNFRAYKTLFQNMTDSPELEGKVIREKFAVVDLSISSDKNLSNIDINLDTGRISTPTDYLELFPEVEKSLIDLELRYWEDELFIENRIANIVESLIGEPDGKRNVITLWKNDLHLNPDTIAPSTIYLYFRLKNNCLDLYTHARTSNAYFLNLLDTHIFIGLLQAVARKIEKKPGHLTQVYDSLLIFKRDQDSVVRQLETMANSPVWKSKCQI